MTLGLLADKSRNQVEKFERLPSRCGNGLWGAWQKVKDPQSENYATAERACDCDDQDHGDEHAAAHRRGFFAAQIESTIGCLKRIRLLNGLEGLRLIDCGLRCHGLLLCSKSGLNVNATIPAELDVFAHGRAAVWTINQWISPIVWCRVG